LKKMPVTGAVVPLRGDRARADASVASEPKQPGIEDSDLVSKARDGDHAAENALARRYVPEVARVVARLLGSHDEVDDIVQDTFLDAFSQLGRLQKTSAFRGWILRIAINKTRNVIRNRRLLRTLGLDRRENDASLESIAHDHLSEEMLIELAAADAVLHRLPVELRIAWLLRHIEGHTIRDVSRLCNCSLATAKRRLAKADERIMRSVDKEVLSRGR
jgi:RNA polymerase sigma-70 factor, ECF subfamily